MAAVDNERARFVRVVIRDPETAAAYGEAKQLGGLFFIRVENALPP
jgi:hypothetical protein